MCTRILVNHSELGYEEIYISDYGYAWYINYELVKSGLVEDANETIAYLIEEYGWVNNLTKLLKNT